MLMNIEKLKNHEIYSLYTFLDEPVPFCELFKGKDFEIVNLTMYEDLNELLGDLIFVGSFKWENGVVTSLDGDSYDPNMKVYGYLVWKDNGIHETELSIIVGTDW